MCGVSHVVPYFYEETYYKYRNFLGFLLFPLICVSKYQLIPSNQTGFIKNEYFLMLFGHQHFMIMQLPLHILLWIFLEKAFKFGRKPEFCTTTAIHRTLLFKVSNFACEMFHMRIVQIYDQNSIFNPWIQTVFRVTDHRIRNIYINNRYSHSIKKTKKAINGHVVVIYQIDINLQSWAYKKCYRVWDCASNDIWRQFKTKFAFSVFQPQFLHCWISYGHLSKKFIVKNML